jgi:hypothetical protein
MASLAGYKIEAFSHAGNTPKIQFSTPFLTRRAAQFLQPLLNVRIGLADGLRGYAYLKGIIAAHASCGIKILGVALIASRVCPKLGLLADGAQDLPESCVNLF